MSLSGLSLDDVLHLLNAWVIDDWRVRIILLTSPGVILNSRGSLRWRTDNILEVFWESGSQDGSILIPVDATERFSFVDPDLAAAEHPEFADIGGGEARYSDCLELSFSFGILLLLRFDLSMFDPPDSA